ncbi:hypothetical protein ACEWY4_013046 [Coilia grayii]|uniref:Uncharacterized protein n=1 Tax=Coilia grayii TaxID=363190 RepID=A0ABD1JVL3_9TELE
MERVMEELGEMEMRLLQDGLRPDANPVERLLHLWRLHLRTEGRMNASRLEVKALQEAHDREIVEVRKKLGYLQALTVKQNSISCKAQEENKQLHAKLDQLVLEKESQREEVAELLVQGGMDEMVAISPSEQVAYLLAERASLLERLQALEALAVEKCSSSPGCPEKMDPEPVEVVKDGIDKLSFHKAVPSRGQSSWKKLLGLRKAAQSKQKLAISSSDEPSESGNAERVRLERDLDEASYRLSLSHKEIRRLNDELESALMTQRTHEMELQSAQQEAELLRQEVEKQRLCVPADLDELRKAKELYEHLDKENRLLKVHIRRMEIERKELIDMAKKIKEDLMNENEDEAKDDSQMLKVEKAEIAIQTDADDVKSVHERCLEELEQKDAELCRLQEATQQLQKRCDQAQQLLGEQEHSHRNTVEAFKEELDFLNTVVKEQADAKQQESQAAMDEYVARIKAQERLLQEKADECTETTAMLERHRSLLQTAEGEVLVERERTARLQQLHQAQTQELESLQERSRQLQDLLSEEQSQRRQNMQQAEAKQQESQAAMDEYLALIKAQERLLQEKADECTEMTAMLERHRSLLQTAEGEVLVERERTARLQQLHQAQTQELESLQERSRQLQDLLSEEQSQHRQNMQELDRLQEELALEKERHHGREKEMQELQEQLKYAACETDSWRREAQAMGDALSKLQADGEQQRKLWLQREEELEQELRGLREQEFSLRESSLQHQQHIQNLLAQHRDQRAALEEGAQEREAQLKGELQSKSQVLSAALEQAANLQKELGNVAPQLSKERAESQRLRDEAKVMADDLGKLRTQGEEAERHRKSWLCREDAFLQQEKTLHNQLASLQHSEQQFQQRALNLEAQLAAQQKAEEKVRQELHATTLQANNKLLDSQNEAHALKLELKQALLDLDKQLSLSEQRITRFRDKLSCAKQFHLKEVEWRDDKIKELQRQCDFLTKKMDKVTELAQSMEKVNSDLLKDKRQFQCDLFKEQEAHRETVTMLQRCTCRVKCLEEIIRKWENGIQDKMILNLIKETRVPSPHQVYEKSPPASIQSALAILERCDNIQKAHTAKEYRGVSPALFLPRTNTSEIGYLNVTPPVTPPDGQSPVDDVSATGGNITAQTETKKSCLTERFL